MKFPKPCITCGVLSPNQYCPEHQATLNRARENNPARLEKKKELYNARYKSLSKRIREGAVTCHLCGEGYRATDPWQADHLIAGDSTSPLAAAHRSCNAKRGNKPLEGGVG